MKVARVAREPGEVAGQAVTEEFGPERPRLPARVPLETRSGHGRGLERV
jgi:hypothetical protein